MSHLKPCPFCGSHNIEVEQDAEEVNEDGYADCTIYACACQFCGTVGPIGLDSDLAEDAWNTRVKCGDQ